MYTLIPDTNDAIPIAFLFTELDVTALAVWEEREEAEAWRVANTNPGHFWVKRIRNFASQPKIFDAVVLDLDEDEVPNPHDLMPMERAIEVWG